MKATIVSTDRIVNLDGVDCRLWLGTTEKGIPFDLFVHRVAVRNDRDDAEFQKELQEMGVPNRAEGWPEEPRSSIDPRLL